MKALIVSKALISASYRAKLRELTRLGLQVIAVVPPSWRDGGRTQLLEPLMPEDYDVVIARIRWNGHFHYHYYPDLPRIIRQHSPDLVHVDEEPYNLATYLAVRAAGRSHIPSLFFSWQNQFRRYPPPFGQMESSVFKRVVYALAGSEEVGSVLRRKGYAKGLAVVPQFGVDPELFHPAPPPAGPFTIGFPNRLIPSKGPLLALDAFEMLPADARLLVVGDGPLWSTMEEEIRRRGLEKRVTLRRRVASAEMPDLVRNLHVVILPSLTTPSWKEQFGRVLIEAMSSGVPVVGSSSGEIPRVVGDAGLIVPENDAGALGAELRRLYEESTLRDELGRRGRHRVLDHFTHARIAQLTCEAYRDAISASAGDAESAPPHAEVPLR